MGDNGKLGSWASVDVHIEGEPLAKDGLRKRRKQLEAIIKPLVTTRKTGDEIQFQGKRRFLKPIPSLHAKYVHAVLALQHLYNIETAWEAGDIDKVVRATIGFVTSDHDRQLVEYAGVGSVEGAMETVRTKQNRVRSRLGRSDLKDVADVLLISIVSKHKRSRKRNWLQLATKDISQQCGKQIDPVTVRREMQRRRIWDTSTKVSDRARTKVHLSA